MQFQTMLCTERKPMAIGELFLKPLAKFIDGLKFSPMRIATAILPLLGYNLCGCAAAAEEKIYCPENAEELRAISSTKITSIRANESGKIVVSVSGENAGIYVSDNNGHAWIRLPTGKNNISDGITPSEASTSSARNLHLERVPVIGRNKVKLLGFFNDIPYVSSNSGLYVSSDKGLHWGLVHGIPVPHPMAHDRYMIQRDDSHLNIGSIISINPRGIIGGMMAAVDGSLYAFNSDRIFLMRKNGDWTVYSRLSEIVSGDRWLTYCIKDGICEN